MKGHRNIHNKVKISVSEYGTLITDSRNKNGANVPKLYITKMINYSKIQKASHKDTPLDWFKAA